MKEELIKVDFDTELIVNKKSASFIEKLLNHFGYDLEHINYKNIIYGKIYPKTKRLEFIKNVYDAYKYLLMNSHSLFSYKTLRRFYFIITENILDENIIDSLINKYYKPHTLDNLSHIIEMYFYIEQLFKDDENKSLISYLYLNAMLVGNGYLPIRFLYNQFIEFEKAKEKYLENEHLPIYEVLLKFITSEPRQPKSHYKKLKPLTLKEIVNTIKDESDLLHKVYEVKSISLYGSFLYDDNRLDSDIDLLVEFNEDISYKVKLAKKVGLEEYLYYKFNRYIDVLELKCNISEKLIEIIKDAKVII